MPQTLSIAQQAAAAGLLLAAPATILLEHWLELAREAGRLPHRRALDPRRMIEALPYIIMLIARPDGRMQVRLAGSRIRLMTGREITGEDWMNLVPPEEHDTRRKRIESSLKKPGGYAEEKTYALRSYKTAGVKTLALPIAEEADGGPGGFICTIVPDLPLAYLNGREEEALPLKAQSARVVPLDLGFGLPSF